MLSMNEACIEIILVMNKLRSTDLGKRVDMRLR